jgi:hypothetical protein
MSFNGYGYYLSSTAALLYCSYFTHNVVAWMKIKPFFTGDHPSFSPRYCKWVCWIFLTTLAMTIPALIFEIFNNFRFFNNYSTLYQTVRPYEPLMRDPWWIFSCLTLFHVIRKGYSLKFFKLIGRSPRFGIMLVAIFLAIVFTIVDILSSIIPGLSGTDGYIPVLSAFNRLANCYNRINPYWKLALVFKCLTDNILLDDFKSVLQRLGDMKEDGTIAMLPNSMNVNPGEKTGSADHREGLGESSSRRRVPDDSENEYKTQGMAANAVGKLGIKIHKLPNLPS